MHAEKIVALMRGEAQYDEETLSGLSKIIEKYPYFQTAHLLNTLNLFHLEDAYFLYELRKTAIYLNDRRKLFFLVENRFFNSDKIEALQHKIPENPDSVFKLIDTFLSEQSENDEITDNTEVTQDFSPASIDYVNHYLSENQEDNSGSDRKLKFQDTIDRFLEKDEISPIKIELNNQDKIEKKVVFDLEQSDDNDFVSETLAKFYVKQRKYDKALEIIRKIILHYPEKSSYFADQIQMLEDLVSINKNKTE